MKRTTTLPILAGFAFLLASGSAFADENVRQVWHDSDDQIVHNSWGNCVRSRWDVGVDPCAPAVVAYQPPPPPPRTIIAAADRTVYFPFNVYQLTPDSQQKLASLAQRINSASDIQDAQVVGYADRIGTTSYNEKLSKKRAEEVRDYLIGRNVITEQDTMTRWVGKSESNTQCPAHATREQLIQCLAPDRKVTVELKYKEQVQQPAPQVNAAPPYMGQPPLAPAAAAHNVEQLRGPMPQTISPHYPAYPMGKNGSLPPYPLEQSVSAEQAGVVEPVVIMPPPSRTPSNVPGGSSVQTYPLQESSVDMQAAPPQPQESQPNSENPASYTMQSTPPDSGQYAEAEYRAAYPPSDHPTDQSQVSDQYQQRYLTTGE